MYSEGNGVQRDDSEALKWLRQAAEQGNTKAQRLLGGHYAVGRGVPLDDVYAYMWLNLAAAQGDELAANFRELVSETMTPLAIMEAQRLAREWLEAHQ